MSKIPMALEELHRSESDLAADLLRLLRELGATAPSAVAVLESQLTDADALAARHAARLSQELAHA